MKQSIKYFIVFVIFIIIMIIIFTVYLERYDRVKYTNIGINILNELKDAESGTYIYKDGYVGNDKNIYSSSSYEFVGNGKVIIDNYKNISFYINGEDFCIYKYPMGDVNYVKNNCNDFDKLTIKVIKNNNQISFESIVENLEYKLSYKDNFKGEWIKPENSGNLILNSYNDGDNYIWFKDENGNLSDTIKFSVDCFDVVNGKYNKDIFYCSGSEVVIDQTNWIVIEDRVEEITLMRKEALENKLSHSNLYTWELSNVNAYLNNVYINTLSSSMKSMLVEKNICEDYINLSCDNNSCGGYKEETIVHNNWTCSKYVKSKIRILSFDEYNYIYSRIGNNKSIRGEYLIINSFSSDKVSIVDSDYSVFILEDVSTLHNIRPVITLKK